MMRKGVCAAGLSFPSSAHCLQRPHPLSASNSPMALGPEPVLAALCVDDRPVMVGQAGRELDFCGEGEGKERVE